MTCEHIKKAIEKMNALIGEVGNSDASLYEKSGPFFRREDIETKLDVDKRFFSSEYRERVVFKEEREIYVKSIRPEELWVKLNEVLGLVVSCRCYDNSQTRQLIESVTTKGQNSNLQSQLQDAREQLESSGGKLVKAEKRIGELEESLNDSNKSNTRNETRAEKLEETEIKLEKTRKLYVDSVSSNASNGGKISVLENVLEKEVGEKKLEMEKREKEVKSLTDLVSRLRGSLDVSQVEKKEREKEIQRLQGEVSKNLSSTEGLADKEKTLAKKEAEIFSLQKQLVQYKIKDYNDELDSAEGVLDSIAQEFKLERKHKRKLRDAYSYLIHLRKNGGKTEISNAEEKIFEIEDELIELLKSKKLGLEEKVLEKNVREFSKQCGKVEESKFELEQWKQKQQYEAHQEYRRP